jgi:conjugative relaxase-like TrwC/TraI family protein
MLSISKMGPGQEDYYTGLASEDYYLEGGEPPGIWVGRGAKELGLSENRVTKEELRNLFNGYSADGKTALVQNAGGDTRQSGWDLTFSAPKTVSVAWSQSEGEARRAFQDAHKAAVEKALRFIEEEAGITRRGSGGLEREKVGLAIATFEHATSRAQDPQLHTHALVLNLGVRADGSTGTIESREIFKLKMAAGALYRAELAHRLETDPRLGLIAERKKSWFELKGVSPALRDEFAKRRKEIETELSRHGLSGAKASQVAALSTRSKKDHIARSELFSRWQSVGDEFGWGRENLISLLKTAPQRNLAFEGEIAAKTAISRLSEGQSHFSRSDFIRAVAEEAQGRGLGANDVLSTVNAGLKGEWGIVPLGSLKGEERYTTKETLALEESMLKRVAVSKTSTSISLSDAALSPVFQSRASMSTEQREAVIHITQGPGSIKVVSGMAGTGKSHMLSAVRDAYEANGVRVIGAAFSGKAAQGLEEGAGIKSETIHKTLSSLERGESSLNKNTVLVVDEAGMVGTRQMERLIAHTESVGAKLVLVGDARQLQPIEAGGPFKAISERLGDVKLTSIQRQREEWARKSVSDFASGRAAEGLSALAERGHLRVMDSPVEAQKQLVADWSKGGVERPEENLILVGTNHEARTVNERAQLHRFRAGKLGAVSVSVNGEAIFAGDRVLFTRNSRMFGVRNGQLGSIEQIDSVSRRVTAKLDNGARVTVPLHEYEHIKLGYAVTTHKAQGITTENAFVLAGGALQDRELSYVQVSRARGLTRFYTDKVSAGERVAELARQMSKSRQKDLAHDVSKSIKLRPELRLIRE